MKKIGLSKNALQLFAIACMTADHIAWYFLPFQTPFSQVLHFFGRMTAPIMCFFIAEGFAHTKSLKNYFLRLLAFAAVSQIPFFLLKQHEFNMLFTLALGLLAICVYENRKIPAWGRGICIALCVLASVFCDWMVFGVLWVLCFHIFRSSKAKTFISFFAVWLAYAIYAVHINVKSYLITGLFENVLYVLYTLGSIAALLLVLFLYNGRRGKSKNLRWLFYSYYPLHLIIIYLVLSCVK